jgi:hypothetical protein
MKSTAARNAAVSSDLSQTDLPQADLSQANVIRWCVLFMNDPSASCRWSCGKVGCGNGLKVWDKNKIMASELACVCTQIDNGQRHGDEGCGFLPKFAADRLRL